MSARATSRFHLTVKKPTQLDFDRLTKLLNDLENHLDTDLGKAIRHFEEIQQLANGTAFAPALDEIGEAMNNFDIDSAKVVMGRIKQSRT